MNAPSGGLPSGNGPPAAGEGAPRGPALRRLRRRLRPRARPRFRGQSFNRLIPNILTLLGLCAGLVAIRFAIEGRFEQSAALIVVAAVIDGLDGRLARLLKATSRFGAEFDSLADFLSFGVAPALILYLWSLDGVPRGLGFAPCLLFAVCAALRLARFNAAIDAPPRPGPHRPALPGFFTGVPAPAGAGLALFPVFLALACEGWDLPLLSRLLHHPAVAALVLVAVGGLMVSTLPTFSFKNSKVPSEAILPLLLGIGAYAALLVAEPWAALAAGGALYAAQVPVALRRHRRLRAEADALLEETPAEAAVPAG